MTARAYLDTSVFGASLNAQHRHHNESRDVLAAAADVEWCISDLVKAEATFAEYIVQWEKAVLSSGIVVTLLPMATPTQALRKFLISAGVLKKDQRHIAIAAAGACGWFLTSDGDFIDPRSKSKKAAVVPTANRAFLRQLKSLSGLVILYPPELPSAKPAGGP